MAKLSKNGKTIGVELTRAENDRLDNEGSIELGEAIPFKTPGGTIYVKPKRGGSLDKKGIHLQVVVGHVWMLAKDDEGELVLVLKRQ